MSEQWIALIEKLPSWLIFVVVFVFMVFKWGPSFFVKYIEVNQKLRDKSDAIKKEYIADLEKQVERLKKKLNDKSK